jgi:hypothetical protein
MMMRKIPPKINKKTTYNKINMIKNTKINNLKMYNQSMNLYHKKIYNQKSTIKTKINKIIAPQMIIKKNQITKIHKKNTHN